MLAICPSNHRSEDLLPPTRVSWNLRLSHMSFLSSLFLMYLFPAQWASCHFHCAGFSLCSASTVGALTKLGFCCAQPLPRGSRAEVVSAKLNPGKGTIYVRGVYNFLGSVLLQQKFEAMDGPVLQLRVTALFDKQRIIHP